MKIPKINLFTNRKSLLRIWIALLAVVIILGVVGAGFYMGRSESASLPWGLLVPSYVFFSLAAAGAILVTSIATVFRVESFKPIVKRGIWLSLALIVPAELFVLLDLGKSTQAYNIYLSFHDTSRLAWMGVLYMVFIITLILQLVNSIREKHMPRWIPMTLGIIALTVALALETNLGALFGSIEAKPLWNDSILPLHFIITAFMAGVCMQILFFGFSYLSKTGEIPAKIRSLFFKSYRPMLIGLIVLNLVVIAVKLIPEAMSVDAAPYVKLLVAGPYSVTFWGLEIIFGCMIPMILLLYKKTRSSFNWLLGASALVIIGIFFSKYDLIIAGQSIGPTFYGQFIPYVPSAYEFLILFGGLAVCLLVYTLGELWLPIETEEEPSWFIFSRHEQPAKGAATDNS